MKRTTLACCLLLASSSFAQKGLHLGVKAIPQAVIYLNSDDSSDPAFGFAYGLGANYHFGERFGLGADLIISNETQKIQFSDSEIENKFSFLKVPLLMHFNGDPNVAVPFHGYIGIQYTLLQKVETTVDGEEAQFTDMNGNDVSSENLFADNNLGVVLGIGPCWSLGEFGLITAIIRWDYHFNNSEDPDAGIFGENRGNTNVTSFGLDVGLRVFIRTNYESRGSE